MAQCPTTLPETEAGRFSALTLNLRFGRAADGPHRWEKRQPALQSLLHAHAADFMCFQEVMDFQATWLQACLPDWGRIGLRSLAPPFWQNNLIFHHRRWTLRRADHFYLSPTPDIPSRARSSRWPRQAVIGLFQNPSGPLLVITTHLDFSEHAQQQAAEVLIQRLSGFPAQAPALLLGDFNCTPESACYRRLTAGREAGDVPGPAFRNVFPPPFPATYHGFRGGLGRRHIDWLLCRGDLRVMEARVLRGRYSGNYPSDHFALRAVFERPGPGENLRLDIRTAKPGSAAPKALGPMGEGAGPLRESQRSITVGRRGETLFSKPGSPAARKVTSASSLPPL